MYKVNDILVLTNQKESLSMSENVREILVKRLNNEREPVESACNVVDGVDVYEELITLFKSDKTEQSILEGIEAEIKEKRDAWCEFLHRAEMNEDEGCDEGFREETMRAENQLFQSHILKKYLDVWESVISKMEYDEGA